MKFPFSRFAAKSPTKNTPKVEVVGGSVSPSDFPRLAQQISLLVGCTSESDEKQRAKQFIEQIMPELRQIVCDLDSLAYNSGKTNLQGGVNFLSDHDYAD